ncbi:hypothetical protein BH10BAC4_BH10BAC4_23750 [soil metagenome]
MKTNTKIVAGMTIGLTVGVIIGMLFAPEKGATTRSMLAEKANALSDAVTDKYAQSKKMIGLKA